MPPRRKPKNSRKSDAFSRPNQDCCDFSRAAINQQFSSIETRPKCLERNDWLRVVSRRYDQDRSMSNLDAEYIRQAEFCQTMAKQAQTMDKRSAWLRLASKWLDLVATDGRSPAAGAVAAAVQESSIGLNHV
jgi:elongation factor P hydroxylase